MFLFGRSEITDVENALCSSNVFLNTDNSLLVMHARCFAAPMVKGRDVLYPKQHEFKSLLNDQKTFGHAVDYLCS